ncbi:mediator of RNA polymerase II transcription subunit 10 [Lindgomyces ingoldianus]|uniref:Mediator of RNA polymerase II transcription subunit 10 n=1 Tax=Lindgomyces ingoldianus TaxID=673940 RepID=A0ACB6QA78_9PLEO|nr:mediator of RNA polymerase II transcription subunit 10 [Lindgomyces ingoldianus]KAF2463287.1 mediator of RNA polymerase II transcription subunit 10 [Lindgomyces ingoldianus]
MEVSDDQQQKLKLVETQLKAIVQSLYNLIVQGLEHQGSATQEAMKQEIQSLIENLVKLSRAAPSVHIDIPPEVTDYVEKARNPDIYTRELVETTQRMNQMLKGRSEAYAQMRDILAKDIILAIPELKDDVRKVAESTGGSIDG